MPRWCQGTLGTPGFPGRAELPTRPAGDTLAGRWTCTGAAGTGLGQEAASTPLPRCRTPVLLVPGAPQGPLQSKELAVFTHPEETYRTGARLYIKLSFQTLS